MKTIRTNAIQIMNENRGEMSLFDYHCIAKGNDPGYLNWLFIEGTAGDYGKGMTDEQASDLQEFEIELSKN